ncbi:MAG: FAD-binding oxidoreductase [Mesorhizobium sp.]|nr:MAG: FAD-binding oxidoreductase [Mesorhizobium sp.]
MQAMVAHPEEPKTHALDSAQVHDATAGMISAGEILGGVLQPGAGQLAASKVGIALANQLDERGVEIDAGRSVTGLVQRGGRIVGVDTSTGHVAADKVVVAAGAWSNSLLEPHGVYLPMVPHMASRLIARPMGIPAAMPALFLTGIASDGQAGNVLWVRQHEGGWCLAECIQYSRGTCSFSLNCPTNSATFRSMAHWRRNVGQNSQRACFRHSPVGQD